MHRRSWALLVALLLAVGTGACGGDDGESGDRGPTRSSILPGKGKPPVRLGTKNFTEQYVLGELYAQALRAKGFTVELKPDIGSTEVTDRALQAGVIDFYPEYTGTALSVVKGQRRTPMTAQETYRQAKAFYRRRGQVLLARTPFEDRDAVAVTREFAERHGGLRETGDLRKLGSRVTLGAAPEFRTRYAGLVGLRSEYGLTELEFKPLLIGETYEALDAGRIQAADVFSTDGQLATGKYVVLEDPKAVFGFQNAAPVVHRRVLRVQGPAFAQTLNAVSAKLTNEVMQRLNAEVVLRGRDPAAVARQFLADNGLLAG